MIEREPAHIPNEGLKLPEDFYQKLDEAGLSISIPARLTVPQTLEHFRQIPLNSFGAHFIDDVDCEGAIFTKPLHLQRFETLFPEEAQELRLYTRMWQELRHISLGNRAEFVTAEDMQELFERHLEIPYFRAYCILTQLVDQEDSHYKEFAKDHLPDEFLTHVFR